MKKKAVILVDVDNVITLLRLRYGQQHADSWLKKLPSWLSEFENEYDFVVKQAYLNPNGSSQYRKAFMLAGFNVVDCPSLTNEGKSAADMKLALDALKLSYTNNHTEHFIIVSDDADFSPLLIELKAQGKSTEICTTANVSHCYKAFANKVTTSYDQAIMTAENANIKQKKVITAKQANALPEFSDRVAQALVKRIHEIMDNSAGHVEVAHLLNNNSPKFKLTIPSHKWGFKNLKLLLSQLDLGEYSYQAGHLYLTSKYKVVVSGTEVRLVSLEKPTSTELYGGDIALFINRIKQIMSHFEGYAFVGDLLNNSQPEKNLAIPKHKWGFGTLKGLLASLDLGEYSYKSGYLLLTSRFDVEVNGVKVKIIAKKLPSKQNKFSHLKVSSNPLTSAIKQRIQIELMTFIKQRNYPAHIREIEFDGLLGAEAQKTNWWGYRSFLNLFEQLETGHYIYENGYIYNPYKFSIVGRYPHATIEQFEDKPKKRLQRLHNIIIKLHRSARMPVLNGEKFKLLFNSLAQAVSEPVADLTSLGDSTYRYILGERKKVKHLNVMCVLQQLQSSGHYFSDSDNAVTLSRKYFNFILSKIEKPNVIFDKYEQKYIMRLTHLLAKPC